MRIWGRFQAESPKASGQIVHGIVLDLTFSVGHLADTMQGFFRDLAKPLPAFGRVDLS
jgi:hypothetical protein